VQKLDRRRSGSGQGSVTAVVGERNGHTELRPHPSPTWKHRIFHCLTQQGRTLLSNMLGKVFADVLFAIEQRVLHDAFSQNRHIIMTVFSVIFI
jgi:hypothetical protein